jgi:hypothetical protein
MSKREQELREIGKILNTIGIILDQMKEEEEAKKAEEPEEEESEFIRELREARKRELKKREEAKKKVIPFDLPPKRLKKKKEEEDDSTYEQKGPADETKNLDQKYTLVVTDPAFGYMAALDEIQKEGLKLLGLTSEATNKCVNCSGACNRYFTSRTIPPGKTRYCPTRKMFV